MVIATIVSLHGAMVSLYGAMVSLQGALVEPSGRHDEPFLRHIFKILILTDLSILSRFNIKFE
jgi:hypothetical protein